MARPAAVWIKFQVAVETGIWKNDFRDVLQSQEQNIRTLVKEKKVKKANVLNLWFEKEKSRIWVKLFWSKTFASL